MKKIALLIILFMVCKICLAQQYALNNSGTLFDSFENPVQGITTNNESRKYAFNLFFPSINNNVFFDGEANTAFKTLLFKQKTTAKGLNNLGNLNSNSLFTSSNIYLFMFKMLKSVKKQRELGFALQLRNEINLNATNEIFAILDNFEVFTKDNYSEVFNGNFFNQAYSQLSVSYRENYDKEWAWGGKLSVLNGISYISTNINSSTLAIDRVNNILTQTFVGTGYSSFGTGVPSASLLVPNFKNPGLSVNLGMSYTSPQGFYLSGNIKDLGFIKWNNEGSKLEFDNSDVVKVFKANDNNLGERFYDKFSIMLDENQTKAGFTSKTNANVQFLASKTFDFYKPNLIIAKNVFQKDGAVALINNFNSKIWNVALNGIYDFRQGFNIGSQFMIKSPNVEFYMGSEKILPSLAFANGFLRSNPNIGSNPTRADFYIGFSLKFGKMMQNFINADEIPGITDGDQGKGVKNLNSKGLFSFLKKKDKGKDKVDKRRDKKK